MGKYIPGEYPEGVSKQRRWAIRKAKEGKCIICGEETVNKHRCQKHIDMHNKLARDAYGRKNA